MAEVTSKMCYDMVEVCYCSAVFEFGIDLSVVACRPMVGCFCFAIRSISRDLHKMKSCINAELWSAGVLILRLFAYVTCLPCVCLCVCE